MVKILRVDDDVHQIIMEMAVKDDRKLTPFLNRLFRDLKAGRINHGLVGLPDDEIQYAVGYDPASPNGDYSATSVLDTQTGEVTTTVHEPEIEELQYGEKPQGLTKVLDDGTEFDMAQLEQACCKKAKPCIHWTPGEDGYKNTLSGIFKPFEVS